jgi:hypothetical protein
VLFIKAAEVNRRVVCHVNKGSILDQSCQFPFLGKSEISDPGVGVG